MSLSAPEISVVTSLYHSAGTIVAFHERMISVLEKLGATYEIILVNDGSPDRSLEIAISLQRKHPFTVVIDLARNFGQHHACMAGLSAARGDLIFLIECDLEEQPEWLEQFYLTRQNNPAADVVYGYQPDRKGRLFERITGSLFYRIFNAIAEIELHPNHVCARLMTRRYVDALLQFRDKELFLGGIYELVGFEKIASPVRKLSLSPTTYTFSRKVKLVLNALTSFSNLPLSLIFFVGFVVSCFAALLGSWVLFRWLFYSISPGWTSIIISIWFMGGLIMFSLGIVGLYLRKVLAEVKNRPSTVIREIYRGKAFVD